MFQVRGMGDLKIVSRWNLQYALEWTAIAILTHLTGFIAQMLKQTAGVISLKMTQLEPLQTNGKQLWVSPLHLI